MAQHDYNIANQSGAAFRADLNNALLAIVSQNSGTSAPSTTFAHQFWADTTTGTLKIRNAANSAWIELMQLDGTLTMEDGTALLPGLAFRDDLNTGLFSDTADTLGISTGGVERVEFGTTATVFNDGGADVDFRIEGDTNANLFFVDAGNDRVGIGTNSASSLLHISGNSGTGRLTIADPANGVTGALTADPTAVSLGTTTNHPVILYTNSVERTRVDTSGRLLVGTPTASASNTSSLEVYRGGISDGDAGKNAILIRKDAFNAGSQTSTLFRMQSGTSTQNIVSMGMFTDSGGNSGGFIDQANGGIGLTFRTGGTERMRIKSDGYIRVTNNGDHTGIIDNSHQFYQSAAQWTTFHVNGNSNPYGIYVRYTGASPNGTGNAFITCYDSGPSLKAEILSNGGLANFSANNSNLCDEREKKNIETLDSTWGCLKNWELKKFHYNEDADTDDKRYGVIAQQVAPHCPEVITDWVKQKAEDAVLDDDGNVVTPAIEEVTRMAVKEQQMMWMAIKALQEAQTRIETLEAEVAALKGA